MIKFNISTRCDMGKMRNIKVSVMLNDETMIRQSPGSKGVWGEHQFFFDDAEREYDYWVVFENLTKPAEVRCRLSNTLLLTGEPPNVHRYPREFTRQFRTVITCNNNIYAPLVIRSQTALPWRVGRVEREGASPLISSDYDSLKALAAPLKTKNISIISSSKAFTPSHKKRLAFALKLKEVFGDNIDLFGFGIHPIEDKWDAIADYKYHIVIENGSFPHYWTEKLSDAYLGWTFPLYYGCPNLESYFAKDAFRRIDLDDFDGSVRQIKSILESDLYERSLDALNAARLKVLDEYNFFPVVSQFVEQHYSETPFESLTIFPFKPIKKKKKGQRILRFLHPAIVTAKKLLRLS